MFKTAGIKAIFYGFLICAASILIVSAACAAFALKSGIGNNLVAICAAASIFIAIFVGSFISAKIGKKPIFAICTGVTAGAVLLFLQFITSEGAFDYIIPLMAVIGAIAAFLLAGKAKPRKKNIKNHTKKHKIK